MVVVRRAIRSDSEDIFNWRNDDLTRQMSHGDEYIDFETHDQWMTSSLSNENRLLLICEDANTSQKAGVVRFDVDNNQAIISINLAPEMRGKGLASQCLIGAIEYFKPAFATVSLIIATVKTQNQSSIRAFQKVGFMLEKTEENVHRYVYRID